jgi:hypothetical protein
MTTLVNLEKVDQSILLISVPLMSLDGDGRTYNRRSKRPIQPSSPLPDQFRCLFRDVRFRLGRLDITKCPPVTSFRYELEAQDSGYQLAPTWLKQLTGLQRGTCSW